MLKRVPRDVWVAAILAATVVLARIFEPANAVFITVFILSCAYIVIQTIKRTPS